MTTAPNDETLIAAMRQRELHVKSRQRAADAIRYEVRRYRAALVAGLAVLGAVVAAMLFLLVVGSPPDMAPWWRATALAAALGAVAGALGAVALLGTGAGKRHLAAREARSRARHATDLHAGRRWLQFYFHGEEISAYIPQILYFYGSRPQLDSVAATLAFVKAGHRQEDPFTDRAIARFADVAGQTNLLTLSTADASGHPSARIMSFVRAGEPGVWFVTTAPEAPKAAELDRGAVALVTLPTPGGATISSNRVAVRRLGAALSRVADLYRDQSPGYLDELSAEEQAAELVYELRLQSARIDSWADHDLVVFGDAATAGQ